MKKMTYSSAGVDIDAGELATKKISRLAKKTFNSRVLTEIGLFAGAYDIGGEKILLSSADGVGTKLIVASMAGIYNTVGIDLVHHCANDIAVHNAEPLFFLDYIGHSNLSVDRISEIVEGLSDGCNHIGAPLIGGETAQMPGIYPPDEFDLVGFIVGMVDKDKIVLGREIKAGDVIIALPSNGLHTNGYSLARKVLFDVGKFSIDDHIDELGESVGEALLKPHTLYLDAVRLVRDRVQIKGM
ncbi:phosphoribosylformylglycinamidine cyclo-ligase, partial [bacterium]